jgi:Holliday junction resolvase-like predicted endonuclease
VKRSLTGICDVFVVKNYIPRGAKGEIDLVGYDGETLAVIEVRTRTVRKIRRLSRN